MASDAVNAGSIPVECIFLMIGLDGKKETVMSKKKQKNKFSMEMFIDKHFFLVASVIFVICVGAVALIVVKVAEARDDKERRLKEQTEMGEIAEDGRDYALEEAPAEITAVMKEYHQALAEYDEAVLTKYLMDANQYELDCIAVKSEYIESYGNIVCYVQKAAAEDAYYVYVSYDLKLNDYKEIMPGVNVFYYCLDGEGNPKICTEEDISEEVKVDLYVAYSRQEVQDLYNSVGLAYNEVLDSNEDLKAFMKGWSEMIKQDMTRRVALREATVETSEVPSEEPTSEPVVEDTTILVEPTTNVNVRGSASEKGELKGQVGPGTQLTCVEQMINGWSHVIYNGADGYIRSDFLKVVGEGSETTAGNFVTVKEGVNIRAKASKDSTVVGMADPGTKLELIEKQNDGWCKIKYNNQEAYVKSEYVQ